MVRNTKQSAAGTDTWVDPFWNYVLGDEEEAKKKRSWGLRRRSKETPKESFLADILSDDRNATSSIRRNSDGQANAQKRTGLFSSTAEDESSLSFFDVESLTNVESAWSFLDQPYELSEKEWKIQQKTETSKAREIQRKEKEAHKIVEKETKIKLKLKNRGIGADDNSLLGVFPSVDNIKPKPRLEQAPVIRPMPSGASHSIVSARTFYDQPYEISERELMRQKKLEKKQEKRNQRKEKQAQKIALRVPKIKLKRTKRKGGNDDDSWLSMFSSDDEGDNPRQRRPFGTKSKQSTDNSSIISSAPWHQSEHTPGLALPKLTSTMGSKSKSKGGNILPKKVWDGLTATIEPWLDDINDEYSSASSYSEVSIETDKSSSVDEESQADTTNSGNDDDELNCNRDVQAFRPSHQPKTNSQRRALSLDITSILRPRDQDMSRETSPQVLRRDELHLSEGFAVARDSDLNRQSLPYAAPVNPFLTTNQVDSTPERWRTTITPVGERDGLLVPNGGRPRNEVNIKERDIPPFSFALSPAPRAVCCSIKNLSPEQLRTAQETGLPVHELTRQDLATIFPKVRSVANGSNYAHPQSLVIGNSLSFEKELPAHVQAILRQEGPQSLYEYDYESAVQKLLLYEAFGTKPRELLKIHVAGGPPESLDNSSVDCNRVIVQVEASTVSPTDCAIRRGDLVGKRHVPLPNSPGVDVVGVLSRVDTYSEKNYNIRKGERVLSLTKWGGNSRYLAVNPEELVKLPIDIDPAEAACLPETYLSVFQVLHHGQSASIRHRSTALRGKSFLLVGNIQSNFGRALGQLAAIGGAENVYATAKPKHIQRLVSFGILPVSTDPLDWCARLQNRVDVIISLDDEPLMPLHYNALKKDGRVIVMAQAKEDMFGETDGGEPKVALLSCARNKKLANTQIHLYDVFTEWDRHLKRCKGDLQYLVELLQAKKIAPHILDRIPLTKVPKAQAMIEMKRLPGFIICEPWLVSKSRAVAL